MTKIMKEARDLLKCEKCAVYLVDLECCEAVMNVKISPIIFALDVPFSLPPPPPLRLVESFGANGSVNESN